MDAQNLAGIPLFANLSKRELREVAQHADEIDLPAGRKLIGQGEFAYEFFAILDGTVEVRRGDEVLAERGPGDFVGEMGIVTHDRRNATVVATSPLCVMVMTSVALQSVERSFPLIAEKIRSAFEERSEVAA